MIKKVLIVLLVLLIVAGVIAFYIFSQPPDQQLSEQFKQDAATKILGRKAQLTEENVPVGNTKYEGKYLTFEYPAKALVYEYKDPNFASNSSRLEDFSFDIKTPKLVFNLQVLENPQLASIDDYPAVRMRSNPSSGYKESVISADNTSGKAYLKDGSEPEQSGFFLKNNKIYSLSITGVSSDEVQKLFSQIVGSVSFSSSH